MQNSFTNKIESARGVLFLLDDSGKVLGQETRRLIGGTKDRPPLAPGARMSFLFVLQSKAPFTRVKVAVASSCSNAADSLTYKTTCRSI